MHPTRSLLVLLAAASLALPACGGLLDTAAAVVDGRKIPEDRFERQLDFLLADPRFVEQFPGEEGRTQARQTARDVLTFLIHQEVVEQYAERNDIDVVEDEVTALLEQHIEGIGGPEEFQRVLRESGAQPSEIRDLFRAQVLREEVADALLQEEVPPEELEAEYRRQLPQFTEVRASHILVESRAEARRILDQATPRNFGGLAREHSRDQESARRGGDLGRIPAGNLPEPLARALVEIPVGEVGGPVQTEFGWHVLLVKARESESFEEARERLTASLRGPLFSEWLQKRLQDVDIQVNPRYGAFDEETAQVVPRTATTPEPTPVQVQP